MFRPWIFRSHQDKSLDSLRPGCRHHYSNAAAMGGADQIDRANTLLVQKFEYSFRAGAATAIESLGTSRVPGSNQVRCIYRANRCEVGNIESPGEGIAH